MAAGTIPISMTQQLDIYGAPLAGGQLYIIQAGTVSTPQDAFADVALTVKQPYPMLLDAAGRVPQFFLDNSINATVKIRLQDKSGVVQLASDGVLIIGPAGGTGGGGGLAGDSSQLAQTGDLKARYGVGVHPGVEPGWVRANGMAIGSITSTGFTDVERANADCHDLFLFLWNQAPFDGGLAVSGGRGTNAATDWGAGKQIRLPDWRGYALAGLCDMGNVASTILSAGFWGGNPIQLGSGGGGESLTLTALQMPVHYHGAVVSDPKHTHASTITLQNSGTFQGNINTSASQGGNAGSPFQASILTVPSVGTGVRISSVANGFDATDSVGGGTAHRTIGPTKLCTFYLKL